MSSSVVADRAACSASTSTRPFGSPAPVHDPQRGVGVLHRGPWHEFEIGRQAVGRGRAAERGECFGQARLVRIVAGDQDRACLYSSRRLEKGSEVAGAGLRAKPDDLDVEHPHAGIADAADGVAQHGGVGGQRRERAAGHRRRNPGADRLVAELCGQRERLGRRHRGGGEIGERIDVRHAGCLRLC